MNVKERTTAIFWIALLLLLFCAFVLFRPILFPFIFGLVLAYMLHPVSGELQHKGLPRLQATLIVLGSAFLAIILILVLLIPLLAAQVTDFAKSLPALIKSVQDYATQEVRNLQNSAWGPLLAERLRNANNPLDSIFNDAATMMTNFLSSIWTSGLALFSALSFVIITPIVACYLLYDWDRMIAYVDHLLPRRAAGRIRAIAAEINHVLAAYLRGQALICLLLALLYGVGLSAIGLNFALLIGLTTGIIAFIPYIGHLTGFITAMLVALSQFGTNYVPFAEIIALFAVGNLLDAYIMQPRFIGQAVGIHPVWLIFSLFAFGSLFGFLGVLLAVPLAATFGVLLRHALHYYIQSSAYLGPTKDRPGGASS